MATSSQQSSSARSKLKTTFGSLRHRPPPAAVPSGTVASRVSYLQSLAATATNRASSNRRSPSSPKARNTVKSKRPPVDDFRDDDERAGFGPRKSASFDYPTQRNNDSHEDAPEEKKHTIMGWQMRRAKNDSDNKSINSIKSSSDKKGFREKVKDVFGHGDRSAPASPEIIYANTRTVSISVRDRGKGHDVPDREIQLTYPLSSTAKAPLPRRRDTVINPPPQQGPLAKVASRDFAEETLIAGHKVHNWLAGHGSGSEASNGRSVATTSTGRVRSVQQMYTSYGIPEPSELFSTALPTSKAVGGDPRRCHVCKWVNVGVERCSCCGHRLCADCAVDPIVAKPKHATETVEIAQLLQEDDYSEEDGSTYSRYSINQFARKTSIEFKEEVFGRTASDRKRSSRHSPMTIKKPTVHKVGIFEERFDLPARDPSIALARAYTTGDGASPPNRHSLANPQVDAEDITKLYQPLREQREELTRSPPIPHEVILEYARTLSPPRIPAPEIAKAHKKSMVKDSPFLKADQKGVRKRTPKPKRVAHKSTQHMHIATGKAKAVSAANRIVASSAAAKDVTPRTPKAPPLHSARHVAALSATSKILSSPVPTKIETVRQDDEMSSVKCDSPTCRATHDGYRPYRHSITCSKKKIIESASSTPTSPKNGVSPLLMSPLMPKPLSPIKRKTEEPKIDDVLAQPAAVPVKNDKPVNENVAEKFKKLSADSERLPRQSSPYSKAVVAVLAKPTELISPLGSDGHEDGTPVPPKAAQFGTPLFGNTRKKRDCAEYSSNGSDFATITSTGQITTIYETSITEHPLHHKNKHNQPRSAHRRGKHKRLSISSGPTRPSRSSAERSHEELVRRKHQALSSHSATALAFCPPIPHIHRIERSTEYIECYPEAGIPQDRTRKSSITYHNTDSQDNQPACNANRASREGKHQNTSSGQLQSDKKLPQADRQEQDLEDWQNERQRVTETLHHLDTREDSIDRGTFTTTRIKGGQHQQKSASDAASPGVRRISDGRPTTPTIQDAMNNEELAQMEADHNSASQGHSAQNFLKQVGSTVKRQGRTVLGYDPLERIVKPRVGLKERKRRVKYGDMDPALANSNQDSDFDTVIQPRHASSGSSTDGSILQLQPIVTSDTSDEPGPSSRTRYTERRQKRSEEKDRADAHHRKIGDTQPGQKGSGDSLEHLTTQPSFGTDHRHQSHPAQVSRQDNGLPAQQRTGQSFAGHETFSHHDTGRIYSDESYDAYFDDNHSTMSGMSREIVFESGPHGKGVVVLPVVMAEEAKYSDGSDLERSQSRKINRAGLRMSKSVRHVTGAVGPKVPVPMPITMEDNTTPIPAKILEDGTENGNELQRRGTVNRAGLRMTNSVRHIVGADGPTSFSHTPARQITTSGSTDMNQTSSDYSGSTFSRGETLSKDIPMAPERMAEYDSYRSAQRRRSARGYSSSKGNSIYQGHSGFYTDTGSAEQLSSGEGYSVRQGPAPSREQPYYYASAPPAATAAELDKIRAQSFSASKMSLFEKQVTAAPSASFFDQGRLSSQPDSSSSPPEDGMLDWWEAQSLNGNHFQYEAADKTSNGTPKSQPKIKPHRTNSTARKEYQSQKERAAFRGESFKESNESMDIDTLPKSINYSFTTLKSQKAQEFVIDKPAQEMKKHDAFKRKLTAFAKRRMEEASEPEGAKKRKLSNDEEENVRAPADKIITIAQVKAANEPAIRSQTPVTSVQKLKEKFSSHAQEKGTLPGMSSSSPQHKDAPLRTSYDKRVLNDQLATVFEASKDRVTVNARFPKLPPPAVFSTDGGRSRISTLSAQQAPALPLVPEAMATDDDADIYNIDRDAPGPSILKWKEKSVPISQYPNVDDHNADIQDMSSCSELPPDLETIRLKDYVVMASIERRHSPSGRLYKSGGGTRQHNSSGQVSVSQVSQTDRCLYCKAVVLKVGLREHRKQCIREKTGEARREQKEEIQGAAKEKDKDKSYFVKGHGNGGDEADKVSVHDLAKAAMKQKERMAERLKMVGAEKPKATSAKTPGPDKYAEAPTAVIVKPETSERGGKIGARAYLVPPHVKAVANKTREEKEKARRRNLGKDISDGNGEETLVQQSNKELAQAGQVQGGPKSATHERDRPLKFRPQEQTAKRQHDSEHHGGRRGTVFMLAERFEGTPAESAIAKTITSTNLTVGAPPLEKKVSSMGADGALSITPAPVPKEELSHAFTMFLAKQFELDIADLGEITIEVVRKKGPLAGERKKMSFEAWRRDGDL